MTPWTWSAWILVALLVFWGIGAYNRVMGLRNAIAKAYAQLDEALVQRAAACEKLLALLRPRMASEQATFDTLDSAQADALAAARAARPRPYAADPVAQLAVATAVHAAAVTRLMSLVEHHLELATDPEVAPLVDELKMVERQRAFSRQVFNKAVAQYNEAVGQFPTRVLTSFFGFSEARSL
ncbi:LemA family protein [Pelomonas sp. CA6]|uniref:LemA family protein n=1 Tax=Pelomonas sp. CA6 TaxID=2907999 RepID=UPI001F4C09BE|nr:LemA family protein [Pelomonas sp. CA6]MCH7343426.1 LemA family protein [Pelomonas sp. CA6]